MADSISEVRSVTLGVADIDTALEVYSSVLGFEEVARGPVPRELGEAWRIPGGAVAQVCQLSQGDDRRGGIRLLSCAIPGESPEGTREWIWGDDAELAGDGLYAVNLRVRDLHPILPKLRAAGVSVPGDPYYWEVSEAVAVWDSMSRDPDGVFLDLFAYERGGELRGPLEREVSVVQTVAIATHDVERCRDFYGALGFEVLFDLHLEGLEELLHVPKGISIHNVNMMKEGAIVPGRVECFRYHGEGLPEPFALRDRAVPGRCGILAMTFESDDLGRATESLLSAGAEPIAPAVATTLPAYGEVRLATFFGPDGECLEVIERRVGGIG